MSVSFVGGGERVKERETERGKGQLSLPTLKKYHSGGLILFTAVTMQREPFFSFFD